MAKFIWDIILVFKSNISSVLLAFMIKSWIKWSQNAYLILNKSIGFELGCLGELWLFRRDLSELYSPAVIDHTLIGAVLIIPSRAVYGGVGTAIPDTHRLHHVTAIQTDVGLLL